MERDITSCSFCMHSYNGQERRPLVLPCSHSYCQNCLEKLESVGDKSCPNCGTHWEDRLVTDLLCCHQLIPVTSPDKRLVARCSEHKLEKSAWCESCRSALCIECIELKHKKCAWYSIKRKRQLVKMEGGKIVSKLKKEIHDQQTLMPFFQEMTVYHEKVALRQVKCQNAIDVYTNASKEVPGGDEIQDLLQLKDAFENIKEFVDTAQGDLLFLQVVKAYQSTNDGKLETFLSKLMVNMDPTEVKNIFSEEMNQTTATEAQIKVASASLKDGVRWEIQDTAHAVAAHRILSSSAARPQDVYFSGSIWKEEDLLKCLTSVSKIACPVYFAPRDTFWKPTERTKKTFRRRMNTLLAPGHKCALKLVWGHLDLPTVQALPHTVENVGVVLGTKEDLDLVKALGERTSRTPGGRLLDYFHLCHAGSFNPSHWGTQLEQYLKGTVPICLHLPDLHQNKLPWMKAVIGKVSRNYKYIGCIHALYLPGTCLDSEAVLGAMKDTKLQTIAKMPVELAPQTGRKELEERFKASKCSVQWDLEAV